MRVLWREFSELARNPKVVPRIRRSPIRSLQSSQELVGSACAIPRFQRFRPDVMKDLGVYRHSVVHLSRLRSPVRKVSTSEQCPRAEKSYGVSQGFRGMHR